MKPGVMGWLSWIFGILAVVVVAWVCYISVSSSGFSFGSSEEETSEVVETEPIEE